MKNPLRQSAGRSNNAPFEAEKGDGFLRKDLRAHLIAMSGEFVGTILFLYFSFGGTQIANSIGGTQPSVQTLMFISLSFGFSLLVTAWAFYRISGGLFNPAVRFTCTGCISDTDNRRSPSACASVEPFHGCVVPSSSQRSLSAELLPPDLCLACFRPHWPSLSS